MRQAVRRVDAALAARAAHVGLGRPQGEPVGGLGETGRLDVDELLVDAQQLLDGPFGLLVRILAEVAKAHAPLLVDQVDRRPGVVAERPPDREVVVDDDWIADP